MLDVEVRHEPKATVIVVPGDLLASSVPDVRARLRELVKSGKTHLVVDLHHTQMIDSTGLGLLLSAYNSVAAADGSFAVRGLSDDLLDLFRSLRISQHFPVSGR